MKNDLLDPGGKKTEGSAPETDARGNFQKGNKYVYLGCNDFDNLIVPNLKRKI